ncbi:MAG: hypothetical protein Fur0032_20590 [Terrimicrobiaceae bacterium]
MPKSTFQSLVAFALLTSAAWSQEDFLIVQDRPAKVVEVERVQPRPSIEGIVKDIFTTRKPWQSINPAAPASYGSGEKNVSKDFGPGTPVKSAGLIVFGVEW